ncbi:MAG: efflux RND transporter periplasmic adaptor subunit [Deltaproteobacteria bacterium]|jgi:RND family efflux transporter MFP subunit|nr:efflux RND transporter periplasmic adaptor subunit [Deltaproteobacteria bacterium]
MYSRKAVVLLNFLLFISSFMLFGCKKNNDKSGQQVNQEYQVGVEVIKVSESSLDNNLVYSGITMPWKKVALSFKASGRIKKLYFEEGDRVEKRKILGQILEEDYWLARKLASIQLETIKPDLERIRKLTELEAVPGAKKDRVEGKWKAAKTQLMQAESMLSGTVLRAPFSGIIVKKMVALGDMVAPSRPVGVLLDMDKMKVVISIPEDQISFYERGKEVKVRIPSLNKTLKGKVFRVSFMIDASTRTYPVSVEIDNIQDKTKLPLIRAGMSTQVIMERPPVQGLYLPLNAIMRNLENKKYIFLVVKGRSKKQIVETGKLFKGKLEILKGVKSGDTVVIKGQEYLKDGVKLKLRGSK